MKRAALVIALAGCAHAPARGEPRAADNVIDIDVRDAPIHDALRMVADKAHVNLSVDPDVAGTVTLHVQAMPARDVLARLASDHALRIERRGPVLHVANASSPALPPAEYTGAPIDVRFDDTPIRTVAQTVSDLAHVSITVDDGVDAAVTLHLRRVPWDLALEHVARKYGLRVVRDGPTIRLAAP